VGLSSEDVRGKVCRVGSDGGCEDGDSLLVVVELEGVLGLGVELH
jgi:hypothetical protein